MRPSNLFIAVIFLAAAGTLMLFSITVLEPKKNSTATDSAEQTSLSVLEKPTVDFGNPSRGAEDAELTIVEFGDHRCEPCATMERDLSRIIADFPGRVRVVWKDLPNEQAHPDSVASAKAARCAGLQGAFWPYHELLLANQGATGTENHVILAAQLGLETESFRTCAASDTMLPVIRRDAEEGVRLRIDATPYVFIGDRRLSGAIGYDLLKAYVESALGANPPVAAPVEPK